MSTREVSLSISAEFGIKVTVQYSLPSAAVDGSWLIVL